MLRYAGTFICFIAIIQGNFLLAQSTASISGRVYDSATDEPLAFATIVLNSANENRLVTGGLSDESGLFVLEGIPSGKYILVCSFLGYEADSLSVLVGEKNSFYDLGRIELSATVAELGEVLVEGERAVVSGQLDRKSFDLGQQAAQSGGSVLDALKALPGITVDQEGKLLLRGSDQVAILVDGKQSGMTGFGQQRGLENIPAGNIERIEIINNPSARYDATGMAGIINIIYKKEKQLGFNGSVGLLMGLGELTTRKEDLPTDLGRYNLNPKINPRLSLNHRSGNTNTYLQAEVLQQKRLPNNEFTTRSYTDGRRTISAVPENRTQTHYIVSTGLDWQLNEQDQLRFSTLFDYESHVDTAQVPFISLPENLRYRYWHWREEEVTGYWDLNLDYEHQFPQVGHDLTLGFQYVRGWEDESYFLNDSSGVRIGTDATHLVATEHTTSFSADYVKPLRSGRFEAGTKLQFRRIPVTYDVTRGQQSIIYQGIGDWSKWGETIYAGYANYLLEKERFDLEGGVRIEEAEVFYDIDDANIYYPRNDAYDYFRLYPNVRLTFKLDPANQLSLFYNQRVDRPGEPNVRIFPKYDDPELLKVGNPYVRPQFTQTYELAYKRIWQSGSVFLSTYFRQIEDPFLRIYNIDDADPNYNIINKIYQNVGSGSNLGIEVLLSQNIGDYWKLSWSLNWYENRIDAFSGNLLFPFQRPFAIPATVDQTWDVKLNNQIDLPGKVQLQLTAIYLAPKNIPQGRQLSRSSVDLGIKHEVLEGKGELIVSFTDMFNDFGLRQEITDKDFSALYENYFETQVLRIGVNYKW